MKSILLAAAALIAAPVFAQTMPSPATPSANAPQDTTTPPTTTTPDTATTTQQAPMTDAAPTTSTVPEQNTSTTTPTPQTPPAGTTGDAGMNGGTAPNATTGGYQPSQPMPMASGGQRPVFTPGPSVEQAFPAPAPLQSYPICKKGQYDKCMQRGGK